MNSNKYSQCGKSDSVNRKRSLKIRLGYLLSKSASYLPSLYRKNAAWRSSCNFERLGEAIFMLRCYRNKKPHQTPRQCLCCSILWQSRTVGSVTWSQPPRVAADHRKYVGKGNDGRRKTKWAANDIQMILYPSHVYMEDMSSLWNEEWRWSFMWSLFWFSSLTWIYCKWMEVSLSLCCAVLSVYFPCTSYIGFLSILEYTTQHFIL